ncbi:kinase-like domain-containing protein, partial [Usnea florida]
MLPEVDAARSFKSCTVNSTPFSGSYNIVFAIEFTDGVVWMLKIPSNGHGQSFDELASKALVSEARTMQMIKKTTTIPIPIVYAFDASLDNELKVPFILMERIDGMPLYKGWFNEERRSKAQLEKFRARALQTLAMAMAQLNRFMLNYGGSLVFDTEGKAIGVAGAKTPDANAMWYSNDRTEDDDVFCEKGPFTDPKSALLFMLDRRPSIPKDDVYLKGIDVLLRTFIGWAYEGAARGPRFVLTHPDFDIQNILVAEDGTLRGLIDWDGVAAVPREVGCASFPLWLMHDYIETQYDYDVLAGKPRKEAGYDESSPDELSCYRAVYAQFMEQEIAIHTNGMATTHGTTSKEEADLTRRSLVMRNLEIATNDPMVAPDIVDHIL